ncbi:hypothetical protein [Streptomyces goshikiensis]|uniref:hypothetical protein n=1 Tax=Streptomyces goshikiensis TaxID=1942 RepID=UPI00340D65F3
MRTAHSSGASHPFPAERRNRSQPAVARAVDGRLAWQATAPAAGREPDGALETARSAVGIAVETGSVRLARELATLERAMRPSRDAGVGRRDLAEILAPMTEGA